MALRDLIRQVRGLNIEKVRLEEDVEKQNKEIAELKKINAQLGTKNRELVIRIREAESGLDETTAALEKVLAKLRAVIQPPNLFGNFVELIGKDKADILHDGRKKRVAIDPEVDKELLMAGVVVIITNETNAIIEVVANPENTGSVLVLERYINDNTAIVKDEHETELVVYISTWVSKEEATPGSKVLVGNGFILGVVESNNESASQRTSKYLLMEPPDVEFDDIGGLDKELELVRTEIEDSFEVPQLYDMYSIPKETHILLHGLPGNGKTMIAKAIAKAMFDKHRDRITPYSPSNFFAIRGPELQIKWIGDTEKELREVFESAASLAKKANAPVFIFFDDCEAFLLRRGAGISSDANMSDVTQFLTLLDGVKEIKGVNVILATNRIDIIDPAVISRMRLKVRVPEPNKDATAKIFKSHLKRIPLHSKYLNEFPGLGADKGKIIDHIVNTVIEKLYRDAKDNNFMEITFQDNESKMIKISDLLSGRVIRDIVDRAKKMVKNRDKNIPEAEWPTGVSAEDLLEAMNLEFKNNEGLPTTKEMIGEWLKQKGITKEVVYTRKLFGEKFGDRRVDHHIQ